MTITPVKLESKFSKDVLDEYKGYVFEALDSLYGVHSKRVKEKLTEWDRIYRGVPKEPVRSFPWENASNIIVQIVGQHTDTLTARILGSIYELDPLWPLKACGIYSSSDKVEEKRDAVEQFLQLNALDSDELDFYRVEQLWFADAIKYGFKAVKAVHESRFEQQIVGDTELRLNIYTGPKVENVNYEDFFCNSSYKTIDDCPFKAERLYLTKQDLEQRRATKKFSASSVSKILLTTPDDNGSTQVQRQTEEYQGLTAPGSTQAFDRWHIFECWCRYFVNGKMYSTVSYVHRASRTFLGGYFNYLPQNKEPYFGARLGYRSSDLYGQGFCELLGHAQEEATAMHNRRNDNATIANLRMFRVSPKAVRLGSNIKLQPMSILRADKDEIETLQMGDVYSSTYEEETLLLQEAANRSGTAPAVAGSGAGTVNKKGVYSSQGTAALMTDGNRRVNLDTMDMRYAHMKVGKFLLELYSYFGVPSHKLAPFGDQAEYIRDGLEQYKQGKLKLSVRAATASVNRELDRQNDVFLTQVFNRHFMSMGQFLQSILTPATPQPIKDYLVRVISASDTLMTRVAKNFGLDNVNSFVPKPAIIDQINDMQNKVADQQKEQARNAEQHNPAVSRDTGNGVSFGTQQGVSDASVIPGAVEDDSSGASPDKSDGESVSQ